MDKVSLLKAVEDACSHLRRCAEDTVRHEDEVNARLADIKAAEAAKRRALELEIGELKKQIDSLATALDGERATVQELQARNATAAAATAAATTSTSTPTARDITKLRSRYDATKKQLDQAVTLARKRKSETLRWVEYADSLELKVKKLEKRRAGSGTTTAGAGAGASASTTAVPDTAMVKRTWKGPSAVAKETVPAQIADAGADVPQGPDGQLLRPNLHTSFASNASLSDEDAQGQKEGDNESGERDVTDQDDVAQLPALRGDVHAMSGSRHDDGQTVHESTQGDPSSDDGNEQHLPVIPAEQGPETHVDKNDMNIQSSLSSDGPEVIWERPAKRTRRDDVGDSGTNTKTRPNTPPLQVVRTVKREPSDSVWRGPGFPVPASQESMDLDEGQLAVPTPRKRHLVYQDNDSSETDEPTPTQSDFALQEAAETTCASATPSTVQDQRPDMTASALIPLSANVRRTVQVDPFQQLKRRVALLADDGEGESRGKRQKALGVTKSAQLRALLNSRPPQPSPIVSVPRAGGSVAEYTASPISGAFGEPPPVRVLPQRRDGTAISTPRNGAPGAAKSTPRDQNVRMGVQGGQGGQTTAGRGGGERQKGGSESVASKKGSLRGRPIGQLKLDDFKINPALNHGETFAYNEVVRSRTDRGSLAGCTDPQCCGKAFRGMAESELIAAGPGHVGRPDSVAMMERYLGDEAYMLARMSPDEKRALWLEAKTHELANKYGKHRHRYHRRASPPGFWDADFPTTQEEAQNNAESARVERAAVQERYREAMRPGGRWLFRDE